MDRLAQSTAFTIGNYDTTNGMGFGDSFSPGTEWKGYVDEARVSSTARSQHWITTEYNNQNSPTTFATLGTVAGTTTNYAYDYRNRMTGTTGGTTSSYGYDVSGERVKAVLGGVTTLSPTRGYSLEGSTPTKQIYAGSTLVATVKGTGASATAYTVATDHLTGSNSVSNSSGSLEQLLDYYPYGSVRLDEKAGSFDQRRKFVGHEYDVSTGLSYMVARYYDGGLGRFYGQDPVFWTNSHLLGQLTDPQSWNAYTYAGNNPMRYIDPNGEWNEQNGAVEEGDTLGQITGIINVLYGTNYSVQDIARLNGIKDPNKISVGQTVIPNQVTPDITNKLQADMQAHADDPNLDIPVYGRKYFYDSVKNGGQWDLKNSPDYNSKTHPFGFVFRGSRIRSDDPGNIHYGYVGASAGWPQTALLWAAGWAQQQAGTSSTDWQKNNKEGNGDDPRDTQIIKWGINLYRQLQPINPNSKGNSNSSK